MADVLTADSCFGLIGPRQCSVALGGPATCTCTYNCKLSLEDVNDLWQRRGRSLISQCGYIYNIVLVFALYLNHHLVQGSA